MLDKSARAVVLMMFPLLSVCSHFHSGFGGLRKSGMKYQSPFGSSARILNTKSMNLRGGGGSKSVSSTSAEHVTSAVSVKVLLRFRMNYKTQYGENLVLLGSLSEFGNLEEPTASEVLAAAAAGKGARMRYINNDDWGLDIVLEME
eukprot:CAMPEP_0172190552 /NCGR_PEP_ID=MMETSP1050-20130122/23181_1 /TAXON_ID=233186 /ORGANISM="Cryptomonas curvata, Strain CCAP979/52" /LENGTH=145 /DNA_ID=CAMNT_0012865447 /DNA_START=89 /DNA_END=523 /DNA_ORIENTATION=+